MNSELKTILSKLISQNSGLFDSLFGPAQLKTRVTIMRLITGNPNHPNSGCGANAVFDALCKMAGTNPEFSRAGQEAQLVRWITEQ